MPDSIQFPGVFVEEIPGGTPIPGVATDITAFVGRTVTGPIEPRDCFGFADFERDFGGRASLYPLGDAVEDFFQNGGRHAVIVRVLENAAPAGRAAELLGDPLQGTGIYALDHVDLFNLLCIPPDPADAGHDELQPLYQVAAAYCQKRRAMLILDPPAAWSGHAREGRFDRIQPADLGIGGLTWRRATARSTSRGSKSSTRQPARSLSSRPAAPSPESLRPPTAHAACGKRRLA